MKKKGRKAGGKGGVKRGRMREWRIEKGKEHVKFDRSELQGMRQRREEERDEREDEFPAN